MNARQPRAFFLRLRLGLQSKSGVSYVWPYLSREAGYDESVFRRAA